MFEFVALPFFQRALVVGVMLSLVMGYLGVLVVLRRIAFFADAIGHSALTGIAIGLLLGINPFLGAVAAAALIAVVIAVGKERTILPLDTILGALFPSAVALGVILVRLSPGYQSDLIVYLFGDILTVTKADVVVSTLVTGAAAIFLLFTRRALIAIAFDDTLARTRGINVAKHELLLLIVLAVIVTLAIKFVGIILVTALLVIPAATAQNIARSVSSMIAISMAISVGAVVAGLLLSGSFNLPSGPAIVLTSAVGFVVSIFLRQTIRLS